MAEAIVMQWLRPLLDRERRELERLQRLEAEVRALTQPHYECTLQLFGVCMACETYQEYLNIMSEDIQEVQERVRGAVAFTASCKDM